MSLKVRTIDKHQHRLPEIDLDLEPFAEVNYGLQLDHSMLMSKLNNSKNLIEVSMLSKLDEDYKLLANREAAYDHFLEVPDKGIPLKRKDISFVFWFFVPEDFSLSSPRFMTFLQGDIGIGGYFVITKGEPSLTRQDRGWLRRNDGRVRGLQLDDRRLCGGLEQLRADGAVVRHEVVGAGHAAATSA